MSNLSLSLRRLLALCVLSAPWMVAQAQTTTTATFQVTANVPSICTTLNANALAFGSYDPTAATANDASTTITIRCAVNTPITVNLNAGSTTGATVAQRLLANGANTLNYNLFTTSGRSTVWGGANTVTGTGQGLDTNTTFTVHGRIPAGQLSAAVGSYSDTITVTVSY